MKNRKTLPTSRQQARRRGLIALVLALLLLFTLLLRYYSTLTPTQVIRTAEASVGVDRTHILEQRTEGGITFTLSRNDEILMVTSYSPKVRQPTDVGQPLLAVDLTHGTDVAAFGAAWPQESRPIYDSAKGKPQTRRNRPMASNVPALSPVIQRPPPSASVVPPIGTWMSSTPRFWRPRITPAISGSVPFPPAPRTTTIPSSSWIRQGTSCGFAT